MSARQIVVCASRIKDPAKRREFVAMFDEARQLFRAAVELRRAAWRLYRTETGAITRAESELFK